eukprot:m.1571117 g.1571117  ORF g.1571117 m.1571117 type:complete len:632 (+) comp25301_c0_seq63:5504-7399(+)
MGCGSSKVVVVGSNIERTPSTAPVKFELSTAVIKASRKLQKSVGELGTSSSIHSIALGDWALEEDNAILRSVANPFKDSWTARVRAIVGFANQCEKFTKTFEWLKEREMDTDAARIKVVKLQRQLGSTEKRMSKVSGSSSVKAKLSTSITQASESIRLAQQDAAAKAQSLDMDVKTSLLTALEALAQGGVSAQAESLKTFNDAKIVLQCITPEPPISDKHTVRIPPKGSASSAGNGYTRLKEVSNQLKRHRKNVESTGSCMENLLGKLEKWGCKEGEPYSMCMQTWAHHGRQWRAVTAKHLDGLQSLAATFDFFLEVEKTITAAWKAKESADKTYGAARKKRQAAEADKSTTDVGARDRAIRECQLKETEAHGYCELAQDTLRAKTLEAHHTKHRKFKSSMEDYVAMNTATCHARQAVFEKLLTAVHSAVTRLRERQPPAVTSRVTPAHGPEAESTTAPTATSSPAPLTTTAAACDTDAAVSLLESGEQAPGCSTRTAAAPHPTDTSGVCPQEATATSGVCPREVAATSGVRPREVAATCGAIDSPFAHHSSSKKAGNSDHAGDQSMPPSYEAAVARSPPDVEAHTTHGHPPREHQDVQTATGSSSSENTGNRSNIQVHLTVHLPDGQSGS